MISEELKELIETSSVSYSNPADDRMSIADITLTASSELSGKISTDCANFLRVAILQGGETDADALYDAYVSSRVSLIEQEMAFTEDIKKYIDTLVPALINSMGVLRSNAAHKKKIRKKVSDLLCREELLALEEFDKAERFRLIKNITDCDGIYSTECPHCGKKVVLKNSVCSTVAIKTEQVKPKYVCLIGVNICECGTALSLRLEEYMMLHKAFNHDCHRAINSVISKGEMITSHVISGISFGLLKDIHPELFITEDSVVPEETVAETKEREFVSDEEFKKAAEIFYKILESKVGTNLSEQKLQDVDKKNNINLMSDDNSDVTGSVSGIIKYPTLSDKESVQGLWTKKDAAMFICQYLGYNYSSEYKVALFSAVRFIAENKLLREAFTEEKCLSYKADVELLKTLKGKTKIEDVDISLRPTVLGVLQKCSSDTKEFSTRVDDSITVLEKCINHQESINTRVMNTLIKHKDFLCNIPKLKITNLSAKDLLTVSISETNISLLDDIANTMIVKNYSAEYFKDWSMKFIEKKTVAEGIFEICSDINKSLEKIQRICTNIGNQYNSPEISYSYDNVFAEANDHEKITDVVIPNINTCLEAFSSGNVKDTLKVLSDTNFDVALISLTNNLGVAEDLYHKASELNDDMNKSELRCVMTEFDDNEIDILENQKFICSDSVAVRFVGETPVEYIQRLQSSKDYLRVDKLGVLDKYLEELIRLQLIGMLDNNYSLKTSFIYHLLIDTCDRSGLLPYFGVNSLQYNINKHAGSIIRSFRKSSEIWKAINKHYSEPLQSFFCNKIELISKMNISVNDQLTELDSIFGLYTEIGTALSNDFAALKREDSSFDIESINAEIANGFEMQYVELLHYFDIETEE